MKRKRKSYYHIRTIVTGYLEKVNAEVFSRYQKEVDIMDEVDLVDLVELVDEVDKKNLRFEI